MGILNLPPQRGFFKQGIYKLKNPQKYVGDPNNVIFRSNLEKRFYKIFDENKNVLKWGVEEFKIDYRSKVDGGQKLRRYYPDAIVQIKNTKGEKQVYMIEIKPKSQCAPPKVRKRKTVKFLKEQNTYQLNQDKWQAAKDFCKKHNMIFRVFHEEYLKDVK